MDKLIIAIISAFKVIYLQYTVADNTELLANSSH